MSKGIYPFELVIKNKDGKELFIETVESVLTSDLQNKNTFGCKICDCHMHVGSKKHLPFFVEAELLFHNSYYNKGFAFCTVELLSKYFSEYDKIMLVGYETFGEMYICETKELIEKQEGKTVEYCIAETVGEHFRIRTTAETEFLKDEEVFFVFIVPINTTLTTHDKLLSSFEKRIQEFGLSLKQIKYINIALIMIAPEENNNDYWRNVPQKTRVATLKTEKKKQLNVLGDREVYYFAKVINTWYNSESCSACFPDIDGKSMISEQAIFEVNRASVVPMLQLGTEEILEPFHDAKLYDENLNIIKIIYLNKFLKHHHITRNGNHYQYYFDTQRFYNYVRHIGGDSGLINWLKDTVRKGINKNNSTDRIIFHWFNNQ